MSTTSSCPTREQLDDLLANRLPAAEAEILRQHLTKCPLCQTRRAPAPAPPERVGMVFPFLSPPRAPGELGWLDDHRILGVLGEGGMSLVFDAEDTLLHRRVALKVLRPQINDPTTRERFLREGRLVAGLPHEHIVTIFQVGEANGVPYLTMENLEGESLESRLERDHWLPLPDAIAYAREAAEGLVVAHEAGLVHRDIKPANIWLESRNGVFQRVKLIDFGIARRVLQDSNLTTAGQILGTPMYMAPEQAAGRPVDARTDIYSLGCVLFQMITGRAPFDGREPHTMALLEAVVKGETPRVSLEAPDLPAPVARLVQAMMSREPAQRPSSAREVISLLDEAEAECRHSGLSQVKVNPPSKRHLIRRPGIVGIWLGIITISLALAVSGYAFLSRFIQPSPHGSGKNAGEVPTREPLKVGIIHSLSGPLAFHERPVARATRFAIEEINKAGGILGREVEIYEEDGASDETVFTTRARQLIEETGVEVLFGCWSSSARKRVADICQHHDRLLFYPALSEGLDDSPNVVTLGALPNQSLTPLVQWLMRERRRQKFFLIATETLYCHVVNSMLKHDIEQGGGKVVGTSFSVPEEGDFSRIVQEIKSSGADVLINTIDGQRTLQLARALRQAGITPNKVPTVWVSLSECELGHFDLKDMLGDLTVGGYFESLATAENKAFVSRFRKHFGPAERVNDPMQTAYFGVYLWKNAVEKAGSTELRVLRKTLREERVDAPEGPIHMDASGHYAFRFARIAEIIEGKSLPQFQIVYSSREAIAPEPFPSWRSHEEWRTMLDALYHKWGNRWEPKR
ncbi:MAG: bifunctional serine/threonine-protein kinase/ABC transporter substrate-binding protein [Gemmataceae bacterium]